MGGYLSPPAADESSESLDFSSEELRDLVFHALAEDLGQGDLTTRVTLPGTMQAQGHLQQQTAAGGGGIAHRANGF